ncbi:hypothetical protein [Myroides odoratus]|uniref:Tfp pilus assembly protein, major pilin PilA n=1 Tax=Myroides odoratus TaxID=256 RepID=A0A378U2U5_MYROD|nr:hypothetical protein [Myroides odoratus]QQU03937.1 hypothetical protein I6I89_01090 [Myroides odoratus]STZ68780.1 Tfp pilus assembly protein, major pilin PilA [Myroides odoratus]
MIKKIGTLVLLLTVLVGCNNKTAYTEIVHDDKFSVEVPSTMQKTRGLNGDATLQLQNVQEELYMIVIRENKNEIDELFKGTTQEGEDIFTQFSSTTLEYLTSTLEQLEPSELKLQDRPIHNLPARVADFTARIGGLDVYYKFAAFEGKEDYYQVLVWTLKEYKDKNQEQINKMVDSFKEVTK